MNNLSKVAFVGPEFIHQAFSTLDDTWDLQVPLISIQDLNNEINSDNGNISPETSLIIYFSRLFDKTPRAFADTVAFLSPYAVNCVIIPEVDAHKKDMIEKKIIESQQEMALRNPEYNVNTPFYFINYDGEPQQEIFDAILDYSKSPNVMESSRKAVKSMLPDDELPVIEEFAEEELELDDSMNIPVKSATDGMVISVTSSKGGSGKSTVSIGIASLIAKYTYIQAKKGLRSSPLRVCLVDLDTRDGQLGFLNNKLNPNIIDIYAKGGKPTIETVPEGVWKNPNSGVDYIFASKRPRNAREIAPAYYIELINVLRKMYDVVILDTSVSYLDPLLEEVAYPMSDRIVFVTDFGISSIYGMARWITEVCRGSKADISGNVKPITEDTVRIVINKAIPEVDMSIQKIQQASSGIQVITALPNSPKLITYLGNTASLDQMLNHPLFYEKYVEAVSNLLPQENFREISHDEYKNTSMLSTY